MGFLNIFDSYGRKKKQKEEAAQIKELRMEDLVADPTVWMTLAEDLTSKKVKIYDWELKGSNIIPFILNNEIYQYVIVEKITKIWKDFIETRNLDVFQDFTVPWLGEEPLHILDGEDIPNFNEIFGYNPDMSVVESHRQNPEYDISNYYTTPVDKYDLYEMFGFDKNTVQILGCREDERGLHLRLSKDISGGVHNGKFVYYRTHSEIKYREPFDDIEIGIYEVYPGTYFWTKEDTYDLFKVDIRRPVVENEGIALESYSKQGAIKDLADKMEKKISTPEFKSYLDGLRDKYMSRVTTILEERHAKAEEKYREVRRQESSDHMSEAMEMLAEAYADAFEAGVVDLITLEDMCSQYGMNVQFLKDKSWMSYNNIYSAGEYVAKRSKAKGEVPVHGMDNRIFDTNKNILQKTKEDQEIDDSRSL